MTIKVGETFMNNNPQFDDGPHTLILYHEIKLKNIVIYTFFLRLVY
jgi:hypothetical protein